MATLYRKALDRELTEKHRSYWEAHQATARGKYVVLVEGDDDRDVLEQALALYSGTWANRTHVAAAGSRKNVLAKLSEEQRWATFGLVDRDAWTKEESEDKVAAAKKTVEKPAPAKPAPAKAPAPKKTAVKKFMVLLYCPLTPLTLTGSKCGSSGGTCQWDLDIFFNF